MKSQNVKCIILGHQNLVEYDKFVFLYTEELGKIKVVAKGARKITSKFMGHLETLNFAIAEIYIGPKNIILKEIITIKNFKKIRNNLERLRAALQIAEITNQIIYENQKIENLFELLTDAMKQLSISNKPLLAAQSYIVKILDKAGMIPDFKTISTKIDKKYLKFLHFLKTQPIQETERIAIDKHEEQIVNGLFQKLIAYSTY
ncbi:MAG: DNA repair protein RecO [Patescibacteria group bacterium]|mgnify:CR=1 FL=1